MFVFLYINYKYLPRSQHLLIFKLKVNKEGINSKIFVVFNLKANIFIAEFYKTLFFFYHKNRKKLKARKFYRYKFLLK